MLFTANIAVEQEVIVPNIIIALFIFTRFCGTPAQVQSKSSSEFALWNRPRSRSTRFARIYVDIVTFLCDWL